MDNSGSGNTYNDARINPLEVDKENSLTTSQQLDSGKISVCDSEEKPIECSQNLEDDSYTQENKSCKPECIEISSTSDFCSNPSTLENLHLKYKNDSLSESGQGSIVDPLFSESIQIE